MEDALNGSATLCRIAEEKTVIPVIQMDFNDFEELDMYDGIWACSSILHLSRQELKQVLVHMEQALHKGGIIYRPGLGSGSMRQINGGICYGDYTGRSRFN